jgi:hypothetical protein
LEEVDRVVTLYDENLCVFVGEEFGVFAILDCDIFEFEATVDQGDHGVNSCFFLGDLYISEYFLKLLLVFEKERSHT